ncbi:MAG: UPF0149 family protein [Gammaproteobacteria bacterium]|jgi:uncharacterized protein YgfB (UPF0149 family)|nr:UPF0149 family protein [Gammaproteobacteria bacterium]
MKNLLQMDRAFERLGAAENAPENHGILCGLLCARGGVAHSEWLTIAAAAAQSDAEGDAAAMEGSGAQALSAAEAAALKALYDDTVARLRSGEGLFSPLLPDDDQPLMARSVAMADWCGGFLYGLAAGGIDDLSALPADVQEIADDLTEISHAGIDDEGSEEDEVAYAELVEYLRAGVTLVYEILEAERGSAADAGDRTIH